MDLREFLVKAKLATYASEQVNEWVLEDGAKELVFESGDYRYRDRYYGFNPFFGEEIVWRNNKIVWFMNYFGKVVSDIVSAKEVYKFLRSAMRQVKEDRPFRGPSYFKSGDFEYIDKSKGDIDSFVGVERIWFRGRDVYWLNYHGGSM